MSIVIIFIIIVCILIAAFDMYSVDNNAFLVLRHLKCLFKMTSYTICHWPMFYKVQFYHTFMEQNQLKQAVLGRKMCHGMSSMYVR